MVEDVKECLPLGRSDHIVGKLKMRCFANISEEIKIHHLYYKSNYREMV